MLGGNLSQIRNARRIDAKELSSGARFYEAGHVHHRSRPAHQTAKALAILKRAQHRFDGQSGQDRICPQATNQDADPPAFGDQPLHQMASDEPGGSGYGSGLEHELRTRAGANGRIEIAGLPFLGALEAGIRVVEAVQIPFLGTGTAQFAR